MSEVTAIGSIDHVVIVVDGLDRAAEVYRRLGFTLSPKGVHSPVLGTENHTIMLRRDYFELLAVATPTERNLSWRQALGRGGGIAGAAFQTEDAEAAGRIWAAAGLNPDPLIRFSRAVPRPSGETLEARFEVVSLPEVEGTGLRVFVCSQPTREAVWLPELMEHDNAALAIRQVVLPVPDPARSAEAWLKVLPNARSRSVEAGILIECGPHSLLLAATAPGGTGEMAASIRFAVADLERCRSVLRSNGIAFDREGQQITVAARAACGATIVFEGP